MHVRRKFHPTLYGIKALHAETGLAHHTLEEILDGRKFPHKDMQA